MEEEKCWYGEEDKEEKGDTESKIRRGTGLLGFVVEGHLLKEF